MTVLYENLRRAKRARLGMLGAVVWSLGWFYWAYVLNSGGTRLGAVIIVVLVGILPFVVLHFYGSAYVVRLARDRDDVVITTLGLFANQEVRVPVTDIIEVARPEASGMTMRVAGRRMPFMLDMQAEHGDLAAIAALAKTKRPKATDCHMLVDSHCHLDFPDLAADLDGVVSRARSAGIGRMVTISTRVRRLPELLSIADRFDDVFCSVGTHPHHAHEELEIGTADLIAKSTHPKVVAIGEAGLDYFYDNSPRNAQEQGFRAHIAAARETGLPLVIHSRDADEDMARILEEETGKGAFPAVLHCFTGGPDLAKRAMALGLHISFTGILTFKASQALRDIAASLPADRIMVETDAPYLAPGKYRGKRNEPAYVVETAKSLSETRGVSREAIAQQTTDNFFRLFSKVPRNISAAA